MKVEKLTTHIGAELSGVSLADAVTNDDLFGAINEALLAHKVLFLRNQEISKAEHESQRKVFVSDVARRFAETTKPRRACYAPGPVPKLPP